LSGTVTPAPDDRPNIFVLYEENIGMLSPILAEELKEAEELYPGGWLESAFHIAVTENKRSWRYIAGILRRWAAEGKDEGKYDGKSGRHPQKDNRQKYLEDFKRQRGRVSR
jgi:DnaD/phage-associated family protein